MQLLRYFCIHNFTGPTSTRSFFRLGGRQRPGGTVRVITKGFFARPGGFNGGDYHDVVRKTEAGWRFVSRTYVPRHVTPTE
jgi:hypothetical protein